MNASKFVVLAAALSCLTPAMALSGSFKESFECSFSKGLANRPTPERVVFSVADYDQFIFLHDVEMPKIDTRPVKGRVKQNSAAVLSVMWDGGFYVYSDTKRSYASNAGRTDAVDMEKTKFYIRLDRGDMTAKVRSVSKLDYVIKDGFAKGSCVAVEARAD